MYKSPFKIIPGFLSPLLCEEIVDELGFESPDTTQDGKPIKTSKHNDEFEAMVFERLNAVIPSLEQHYDFEYKGTEKLEFEWIPEGASIDPHCESAEFIGGNWVKTRYRDFTCVIFLTDFNDNPPFDDDFEVYGGKLEFPSHQFGFNPQRGTMIVYPSDPRFANATSTAIVGDLHQIRVHIAAKEQYIYNPREFPGNYTVWFN